MSANPPLRQENQRASVSTSPVRRVSLARKTERLLRLFEDQVRGVKQPGDAGAVGVEPVETMAAKLRAAVAACRGTEMQILARCDAVALEGLEGAMRRADRYLAAGAHGLSAFSSPRANCMPSCAASLAVRPPPR